MLAEPAGHRLAEQRFRLADQLGLHVRKHAVKIEAYAQCHRITLDS